MPPIGVGAILSWSGGKDSALALQALRAAGEVQVDALLATVTAGTGRIGMHGVRVELVRAQAAALGLPLVELELPPLCPNALYEARLLEALAGRGQVAFGDLFLEDIRAYRETLAAGAGARCLFPLWGLDTAALAARFVAEGFRAVLVCVDPRALDASFAGRAFDRALLADLPPGVDPCGENGEFHTFVWDGPIFAVPVPVAPGAVVERDGFVFADLAAA